MTWDCLSAEVSVMFAEHTNREHDRQLSLEWWASERIAVRQRSNKIWRTLNHKRVLEMKRRWRQTPQGRAYFREYMRNWRAENADRARATALKSQRKRRQANPEAHREYMRQWRAKNVERERERLRKWRKENPERDREYQRRKYLRDKAKRAA